MDMDLEAILNEFEMDPRERLFVLAYVTDFNASRAARTAGWSPRSCRRRGFELIRKPEVRGAIEAICYAREHSLANTVKKKIAAEELVLQRWLDIVLADENELVQHRRSCCRYCYGIGGLYQRTNAEMWRDRKAWARSPQGLAEEFDEQGGDGFNSTLDPNPECLECFGEGVPNVHVTDTRDLTPAARALYAGVKQTKEGVEVRMHSKEKALEFLAKHHGILKDKVEVDGSLGLIEKLAEGRKRTGGGA